MAVSRLLEGKPDLLPLRMIVEGVAVAEPSRKAMGVVARGWTGIHFPNEELKAKTLVPHFALAKQDPQTGSQTKPQTILICQFFWVVV